MRQHIVPSIVASIVAIGATLGLAHFTKPEPFNSALLGPHSFDVNGNPKPLSAAKVALVAKTTWPELSQKQVDALTLALKENAENLAGSAKVTIFCFDDAKCGDLALNLDNAFSTAHWDSQIRSSSMIPPGVLTSTAALQTLINGVAPELNVKLDAKSNAGPGEFIAIGARP